MKKITPFLWFENQAEEAANYYVSIFKNGRIKDSLRQGAGGPAITVAFEIEGNDFVALNGRPKDFGFNDSVSFSVSCDTQEEIDHFWSKLTADGGKESMCGWLKDKYGVAWQITPPILIKRIQDKDPQKAAKVMQAMMQMRKIDIQKIEDAYNS